MKLLHKAFYASVILLMLDSCKKDEKLDVEQPVGLGGEVTASTAIDKWVLDSLTKPYNIAVKYRWDPWEYNLDKTLTPPDESKIVPALSAIKRVWIDPYNAETGSDLFIKKYSPKQFVMVGSVEYNYNGTVVLGQAEGGNNIAFFDVNQNFDKNNVESIKRMIQTSHHEFAHILHQTVMYPQDFKFITSNLGLPGYTATWFNISPAQALQWGYITPYSMASYDEDFVEMIANMLMEGKTRFDEIIASTNPTAQAALRAKEQIVVEYYRQVWNIDFYSLQRRVQAAINALVPPATVAESYGFGKTYTRASVNPANQTMLPQPAAFMNIYNTAKNNVAALPNFGLTMDSMAVITNSATTAIVRIYVRQNNTTFFADYNYTLTKGAGDVYSFTYLSANGNGELIKSAVDPLLNYFSGNQFTITWFADPSVSTNPRVKFTPQASPGTYFIARLLP
ncbi:MAG TPA: putative zinc-binding metallopeptidase [Chitinophagaceae bacterium]|jgi:substrate import-associated zinc metallohydrolase lipoprotein|nr:putative zinc-binding metallopeptidase [Chitinophagaceae bacterium]